VSVYHASMMVEGTEPYSGSLISSRMVQRRQGKGGALPLAPPIRPIMSNSTTFQISEQALN